MCDKYQKSIRIDVLYTNINDNPENNKGNLPNVNQNEGLSLENLAPIRPSMGI
jgi:hypothetical protein